MNAPESTDHAPQDDGPINPYAAPSGQAEVASPEERRDAFTSILGWVLVVVGTAGTAIFVFFAGLLMSYASGQNEPWALYAMGVGYCILYAGGIAVMLAILHDGWKKPFASKHVLPAVGWTLAFLVACEFAFFVVCTAVSFR